MNAKDLITLHEGRMLKAYIDTVGKVTVGVGRNISDKGIRDDEADLMLKNDMQEAWDECAKYPWFLGLSEARKAACLDVQFNLGAARFRTFSKFISAMSMGDWETAAAELAASKWATQVGTRARHIEDLIRAEKWPV